MLWSIFWSFIFDVSGNEMTAYVNCNLDLNGEGLVFEASTAEITLGKNVRVEEAEKFCDPNRNNFLIIFDEIMSFDKLFYYCSVLGGNVPAPEQEEFDNFMELVSNVNCHGSPKLWGGLRRQGGTDYDFIYLSTYTALRSTRVKI